MSKKASLRASIFGIACAGLLSLSTAWGAVTSAFDGNWFDPVTAGQGFTFETYPDAEGKLTLVVIHFTYDSEGRPTFFTASAPVAPGRMTMDLLRPVLGSQTEPGVFGAPQFIKTGKIELDFQGCRGADAKVTFDNPSVGGYEILPGKGGVVGKVRVGTGSFRLQRLGASVQVKRCTGGISDDKAVGQRPVGFDQVIVRPRYGVRAIFAQRPDASDFRLEFRDLPVGSYRVLLDGRVISTFGSVPFGDSTRGEARFRSPQLPEITELLDFEPSGRIFELRGQGANVGITDNFTTTTGLFEIGVTATPSSNLPVATSSQSFGVLQLRGQLSGAQAGFLLNSQFERSGGVEEFKLYVEGAPVGLYDVHINGLRKGYLEMYLRSDSSTRGEIYFRTPNTVDSYPLDFNHVGATVEFYRDGVLEFGTTLADSQ